MVALSVEHLDYECRRIAGPTWDDRLVASIRLGESPTPFLRKHCDRPPYHPFPFLLMSSQISRFSARSGSQRLKSVACSAGLMIVSSSARWTMNNQSVLSTHQLSSPAGAVDVIGVKSSK